MNEGTSLAYCPDMNPARRAETIPTKQSLNVPQNIVPLSSLEHSRQNFPAATMTLQCGHWTVDEAGAALGWTGNTGAAATETAGRGEGAGLSGITGMAGFTACAVSEEETI